MHAHLHRLTLLVAIALLPTTNAFGESTHSYPVATPSLVNFQVPFERLFNTRGERDALESPPAPPVTLPEGLSNDSLFAPRKQAVVIATPSKPPPPVSFSGIVYRADGTQVLWLNGTTQIRDQATPLPAPLDTVKISREGLTRSLKPGQVWDVHNNTVREQYQITPATKTAADKPAP